MKNSKIEISSNWTILRDEFYDIDPFDKSFPENEKFIKIFVQEDLLLLNNGKFFLDVGWYGGSQNGHYKLYLYKGENWHNCQLLEKYSTIEYQFLINSICNIARNVDDKFYDTIDINYGSIDEYSSEEIVSKFQVTHSIIKHPDKILALEFYLKSNKNDNEGDSWLFGHNPNIIEHLNSFSKEECQTLNIKSEKWDDNMLYSLADPVFQCDNENVSGSYFYCKIFLQINILEDLEYLIENLAAITWSIREHRPKEFYEQLLNKAIEVNENSQGNYEYTIKRLKEKADNM